MKRIILSFASAIALAACQPSTTTEVETVDVETPAPVEASASFSSLETVFADGTYTISWSFDDTSAPVSIQLVGDPQATSGDLLGENITADHFTWTPEAGVTERHYFLVSAENGETELTATRLLPLEGGRNFRTLGGYETTDGRTVVWDKLYRSGVMHGITEADYDYLSSLDIKVVCDLRTEEERTSEPTNWAAGDIDYLFFPDPTEDMSFMSVLMDPDVTPQDVRDAFGGAYYGIGHQQAPAYRDMFDRLAAGQAPLAFNCSAGKDRTGVAAALLLTALGVPRDTIVHDYQLSDDYVDYMKEFMGEEARARMLEENPSYAFFLQLPPEIVEPIMATHPEYIEKFFADIEAEYGTVDAFLEQVIDVTPEEIAALRTLYLN